MCDNCAIKWECKSGNEIDVGALLNGATFWVDINDRLFNLSGRCCSAIPFWEWCENEHRLGYWEWREND
jgi:hypothetical protein